MEGADVTRCEWSRLGQVSNADFASIRTLEESHHEPLEFLGGVFKGLQLR